MYFKVPENFIRHIFLDWVFVVNIPFFRRGSWFNGYRRRKSAQRPKFKPCKRMFVPLQYQREFRPCRGKSWQTLETLFNYPKVYSLLPLVSSRREKERENGNWDDSVSKTKINNVSWWEKESKHRLWILVQGFFWSAPIKMGGRLVFNCTSLTYHVSSSPPQNTSRLLLSA